MNISANTVQKPSLRSVMAAANDVISLCNVYTRNSVNHHATIPFKRGAEELAELCFGIQQEYSSRFVNTGMAFSDARYQWEDSKAPLVLEKLASLRNTLDTLSTTPNIQDMGFRSEKGNK